MEMKIADQTTRFGAGVKVKLTPDQYKTRSHVLKKLADDIFETTGPVEFKRGEGYGLVNGAELPPRNFDVTSLKPAVAAKDINPAKRPKAGK